MGQDGWPPCDRCGDRWRADYMRRVLVGDGEHWLCANCVMVICEWWCLDHAQAIKEARAQRARGEQAYVR